MGCSLGSSSVSRVLICASETRVNQRVPHLKSSYLAAAWEEITTAVTKMCIGRSEEGDIDMILTQWKRCIENEL